MLTFNPAKAEEIWSECFSFDGPKLNKDEWLKKSPFWKESAIDTAARILGNRNPAQRLGTGGGKTIITVLTATLLNARTIFITPTRYLANQHQELLYNTLGYRHASRVITGETTNKKRIWNDESDRFVIATGKIFQDALTNKLVSPHDFDFLIIDEVHRARGKYPYVEITARFETEGIPRLGLSASPGGTVPEVELTLHNANLDALSSLQTVMPPKTKDTRFIRVPRGMVCSDEDAWKVLGEKFLGYLKDVRFIRNDTKVLPAKKLLTFDPVIANMTPTERKSRIRQLLALYKQYQYCRRTFMVGSFYSFLLYVEKIRERNWPTDRMLLNEDLFRKLIDVAIRFKDMHPKVVELVKILKTEKKIGGRAVVFFDDRNTAIYCKEILAHHGVITETVFGGGKKVSKKTHETIEDLCTSKITAILATSVLHEGVSIPEVDVVINYAVPKSAIVNMQSNGRTGRMRPGYVIYLVLDHDLDRLTYFSVQRKTKKMNDLATFESLPKEKRKGQRSLHVT